MEQSLAFFKQREGEVFHLQADNLADYTLKLTEVAERKQAPEGWECFTVYFEGPKEPLLNQQMVQLVAKSDGAEIPIFVVPVETHGEVAVYEAIYNRNIANKA